MSRNTIEQKFDTAQTVGSLLAEALQECEGVEGFASTAHNLQKLIDKVEALELKYSARYHRETVR